jgi:Leucine-rich repeat (LRR) protein
LSTAAPWPRLFSLQGPLHILVNCEKLSLSTNLITQIQNLQVLKNLKVLSLGRNLIKSLQVYSTHARNNFKNVHKICGTGLFSLNTTT